MDLKQVKPKLVGADDERAVSPVIGVILMVAITVILAAVIAAFVLDMGSSVQSDVQAGANIDSDATDNEIRVTFTSSQEGDTTLNVVIANSTGTAGEHNLTSVGDGYTFSGLNDEEYTVTVTGINGDRSTVVQDTEVDLS